MIDYLFQIISAAQSAGHIYDYREGHARRLHELLRHKAIKFLPQSPISWQPNVLKLQYFKP